MTSFRGVGLSHKQDFSNAFATADYSGRVSISCVFVGEHIQATEIATFFL